MEIAPETWVIQATQGGGPPHFAHGMVAELTVT